MDKSILDTVHESASDLHKAGVMTEMTIREFDALCLPKVKGSEVQWYENVR